MEVCSFLVRGRDLSGPFEAASRLLSRLSNSSSSSPELFWVSELQLAVRLVVSSSSSSTLDDSPFLHWAGVASARSHSVTLPSGGNIWSGKVSSTEARNLRLVEVDRSSLCSPFCSSFSDSNASCRLSPSSSSLNAFSVARVPQSTSLHLLGRSVSNLPANFALTENQRASLSAAFSRTDSSIGTDLSRS